MSVVLQSSGGGSVTLQEPATASTRTLTLPDATGFVPSSAINYTGGLVPNAQCFRVDSAIAGSNATGAQSVFGVGVTLAANTVYAFEMYVVLNKTAGTTSHSLSMLYGGTATLNNIIYGGTYNNSSVVFASGTVVGAATIGSTTASAITLGTTASAGSNYQIGVRGTVSINAGGTFVPQYSLSAAPGGAYSTVAGSYFVIYPIGASGANVNVGTWA